MGISFKPLIVLLIIGIQLQSTHHVFSQSTYNEYAHRFSNYDFSKRVVPRIPPKEEQIKVIIDADAKNEIDEPVGISIGVIIFLKDSISKELSELLSPGADL